MDEALLLKGVHKTFKGHISIGSFHVLRGVSLRVPKGVIYGFLGPNGAGKTTTLKIVAGLLFRDAGEVSILGCPIEDRSVRGRMGFLPEAPYFYDYLSGAELLDFMGRLQGVPAEALESRIPGLLKTVGLQGKERLQLRKYSKGMLQRVGLAQALLNDPDLVILDEPMSGLDPIGRREIRDLILSLKEQGKTVFFSSHILADAEMICDQVAILVKGLVVQDGPVESLLGAEVQFWDVTLREARDLVPGAGCSILARQGTQLLMRVEKEEVLQGLLDRAREGGASIRAVVPHKISLEDLFLSHTSGENV